MNFELWVKFLVAMMAIANPIEKVPLWLEAVGEEDRPVQIRLAALIVLTAALVLLAVLWLGRPALQMFGTDLAAFRIGGGVVIFIFGLRMLDGKPGGDLDCAKEANGESPSQRAKSRFRCVVVPLATPVIAGPGAISTAIVYSSKAEGLLDYLAMSAVIGLVLSTIFISMLLGRRIQRILGEVGLEIITRLLGLLLCGIAAQLVVQGLGEVFPALVTLR